MDDVISDTIGIIYDKFDELCAISYKVDNKTVILNEKVKVMPELIINPNNFIRLIIITATFVAR